MKRGGRQGESEDPRKPERERLLAPAARLARDGRLYPSVILHGGDLTDRNEGAAELARTLLCERGPDEAGRHTHSFLGKITGDDWGVVMYKHLDHHLRQFGA